MEYLTSLMQTLNKITKSDYFSLITFILTIISISLAYMFYRKSRKFIRLSHKFSSYSLIENNESKFPRLKVLYNDKQLNNFSIAQLSIKNSCNTSIKSTDIAPTDPIKITAHEGAEILEAEIISQLNSSNNFRIIKDDNNNSIIVAFDFVDPKEEACIQIYHTGITPDSLVVSGSIIGEDKPFTKSEKTGFTSRVLNFQTNIIKFTFDPKLRWARILLDLIIGVGLISYAFLIKPNVWLWLFSILFGILSLIAGIRRIVKPDHFSEDKLQRLEYVTNVASQDAAKRMKNIFKNISPTKDK